MYPYYLCTTGAKITQQIPWRHEDHSLVKKHKALWAFQVMMMAILHAFPKTHIHIIFALLHLYENKIIYIFNFLHSMCRGCTAKDSICSQSSESSVSSERSVPSLLMFMPIEPSNSRREMGKQFLFSDKQECILHM